MMKKTLLFSLLLSASTAFADRTINIAMGSGNGQLELTNPSTVAVNYSVKCFNAGGTAVTNLTGLTLAPNGSAKHVAGEPDLGTCASGYSNNLIGTDHFGKKVYSCTGGTGVPYASAQTICGPGRKFCFPAGQGAGCGFGFYGLNAWLKNEGTIEKYDYGTCTYVLLDNAQVIYAPASCGSYALRKNPSEPLHYSLDHDTNAAANRGAICCEDPVPAGVCKVTITGAAGAGFLASPQFKGGASF